MARREKKKNLRRALALSPFVLLASSLLFDSIASFAADPLYSEIGFWVMGLGLVLGFILGPLFEPAPLFPQDDFLGATASGLRTNRPLIAALLSFSLAWLLRRAHPSDPSVISLTLSTAGVVAIFLLGKARPNTARRPLARTR